jgi:glycosyltransferase involved in cell wall biosynthesis
MESGHGMSVKIQAPVTVVIPCFRAAATIGRAIASVATQSWRPAEVIIVDDASDDETPKVLKELQHQHDPEWLRVIRLPVNSGPGAARNVGWDAATEQYIAFLDADDSWHPEKISIQLKYMLATPDVDFTAHLWRIAQGRDEENHVREDFKVSPLTAWELLFRNPIATSTVVVKKCLPHRFSCRRFSEDYELWLDLLLSGYKGALIKCVLAYLHKAPYGEGGLSGDLWAMERGELETYWRLFRKGRLGVRHLFVCVPWSLAKYMRRTVVSVARRIEW